MQGRNGEDDKRHRLVQHGERERRGHHKRDDAERNLRADDGRERYRADPRRPSLAAAPDIDDMEKRHGDEAVGEHAMVELNGERVLEEIPPHRLVEQQARRHERAVDQRPGVVDEPGMKARDQRAEIDLRNDEHDETGGGDADAPRHRRLRRRRP